MAEPLSDSELEILESRLERDFIPEDFDIVEMWLRRLFATYEDLLILQELRETNSSQEQKDG